MCKNFARIDLRKKVMNNSKILFFFENIKKTQNLVKKLDTTYTTMCFEIFL